MFRGGWGCDQQESGHTGFNDECAVVVEFEDDAFAESRDAVQTVAGKSADGRSVGGDADRFAGTGGKLNRGDLTAFAVRTNSADHGFHFREFGHLGDF
jgi:hypothetical protein